MLYSFPVGVLDVTVPFPSFPVGVLTVLDVTVPSPSFPVGVLTALGITVPSPSFPVGVLTALGITVPFPSFPVGVLTTLAVPLSPKLWLASDVKTDKITAMPTVDPTIFQSIPPRRWVVPIDATAVCAAVFTARSIKSIRKFFIIKDHAFLRNAPKKGGI
jgi:hypothetical protein